MIWVRVLWTLAIALLLAAAALYISDPSTAHWYLYFVGAAPFVVLILLRMLAIQKRNPESKFEPGGAQGPGLYEPPP